MGGRKIEVTRARSLRLGAGSGSGGDQDSPVPGGGQVPVLLPLGQNVLPWEEANAAEERRDKEG